MRWDKKLRRAWLARVVLGSTSIVSILLLWEVLVRIGALSARDFSSPFRARSVILREADTLTTALGRTLGSALLGFSVALLIAPPIGYFMAQSRTIERFAKPVVEFLRPLPSTVMILVSAVALGIGWRSEIAVVAYGSLWPLLIGTYDGVINTPNDRRDTLAVLNLSRLEELWFVHSRAVLPSLLSGVKVAASIAVILAVTFEVILSGSRGLGVYLQRAMNTASTDRLYAAVLVAGLGGLAVNTLVAFICDGIRERVTGRSPK